jgi:hypothetical protein
MKLILILLFVILYIASTSGNGCISLITTVNDARALTTSPTPDNVAILSYDVNSYISLMGYYFTAASSLAVTSISNEANGVTVSNAAHRYQAIIGYAEKMASDWCKNATQ